MFLSEAEFVGPPVQAFQPTQAASWYDSINWSDLLKTGVETWGKVEAVKTQREIVKTQATSPYRATAAYPRAGTMLSRSTGFPLQNGEYYQPDNTLLYLSLGAAGLLALFLVMK